MLEEFVTTAEKRGILFKHFKRQGWGLPSDDIPMRIQDSTVWYATQPNTLGELALYITTTDPREKEELFSCDKYRFGMIQTHYTSAQEVAIDQDGIISLAHEDDSHLAGLSGKDLIYRMLDLYQGGFSEHWTIPSTSPLGQIEKIAGNDGFDRTHFRKEKTPRGAVACYAVNGVQVKIDVSNQKLAQMFKRNFHLRYVHFMQELHPMDFTVKHGHHITKIRQFRKKIEPENWQEQIQKVIEGKYFLTPNFTDTIESHALSGKVSIGLKQRKGEKTGYFTQSWGKLTLKMYDFHNHTTEKIRKKELNPQAYLWMLSECVEDSIAQWTLQTGKKEESVRFKWNGRGWQYLEYTRKENGKKEANVFVDPVKFIEQALTVKSKVDLGAAEMQVGVLFNNVQIKEMKTQRSGSLRF